MPPPWCKFLYAFREPNQLTGRLAVYENSVTYPTVIISQNFETRVQGTWELISKEYILLGVTRLPLLLQTTWEFSLGLNRLIINRVFNESSTQVPGFGLPQVKLKLAESSRALNKPGVCCTNLAHLIRRLRTGSSLSAGRLHYYLLLLLFTICCFTVLL